MTGQRTMQVDVGLLDPLGVAPPRLGLPDVLDVAGGRVEVEGKLEGKVTRRGDARSAEAARDTGVSAWSSCPSETDVALCTRSCTAGSGVQRVRVWGRGAEDEDSEDGAGQCAPSSSRTTSSEQQPEEPC